MATPKVLSRWGSWLVTATCATTRASRPASLSVVLPLTRRQLTTTVRLKKQSKEPQSESIVAQKIPLPRDERIHHSRRFILQNLPEEVLPIEIEALFKDRGFKITRIKMLLNRFSFVNSRYCFIELASEAEVHWALENLPNLTYDGEEIKIKIQRLENDFDWDRDPKDSSEYVQDLSKAFNPVLENRRVSFCAQYPFWAADGHDWRTSLKVITKHVGKYGIEHISRLRQPNRTDVHGIRFLCYIDFETREGAQAAIAALNLTNVDGRRVNLYLTKINSWTVHQLGKWKPELVRMLSDKEAQRRVHFPSIYRLELDTGEETGEP